MIRLNRDHFWEKYRAGFSSLGERLEEAEVTAVNGFIDRLEVDPRVTDVHHVSYMLMTARWEQDRYRAPRERGSETYLRYLLGKLGNSSDPAKRHHVYYRGGGPCHVTGLSNFKFVDEKLGLNGDLVAHPEKITGPDVGYETMVRGHEEGWFSGGKHKLSDYFDSKEDPRGARRVINGGELSIANKGLTLPNGHRSKRQKQCIEALDTQVKWYWVIQAAIRAALEAFPEGAPIEPSEQAIDSIEHLDELDLPESVSEVPEVSEYEEGAPASALVTTGQASANVSVKGIDVEVKTSEGPKVEERVAIEKPESKNFLEGIRKQIATVTGGNVTLQAIRDYAEQAKFLGLSSRFWFWMSLIAIAATLIYLLSAFYKHRSDAKRELELTNQLIQANTTPDNKVSLVDKDKVEEYAKLGYKIVHR